jgi:hypothetical protein
MKILRIALRATFPAILYTLIPGTPLSAQLEPISETPIPGAQATGGSATIPSQTFNPSTISGSSPSLPTSSTPSFFDSIFKQKLPIDFGFHIGEVHSDNIFYQVKKTDDYITEISPSFDIILGQKLALEPALDQETTDIREDAGNQSYFRLSFKPTLILFSRNSYLDDVDEHADVIYTHLFGRLTLSVEQSYEKLSQPTVQTNAQNSLIKRDIYTTTARANYFYSDQLSTYATFTQKLTSYLSDDYTDSTEWEGDYYFLYQLFPKLSVGFGPLIGFDDIQRAANQTYQAGLIHAAYVPSAKFHLAGAAGAEVRQFEHDTAPEKVTPIVDGGATYEPFDSMQITLAGERHRIVSSGLGGDDYTASVATLSIRQRFFQVVYLTAAAVYEEDQYTAAAGGGIARDDEISLLRGGVQWQSFRGITIDASYQYLQDHSNIPIFSFDESRATISASFKY